MTLTLEAPHRQHRPTTLDPATRLANRATVRAMAAALNPVMDWRQAAADVLRASEYNEAALQRALRRLDGSHVGRPTWLAAQRAAELVRIALLRLAVAR